MESVEIKKLEGAIEAILFTMGDSVELGKIAAAVEHDEDTVRKIIHQMMDKYEEETGESGSWNWRIPSRCAPSRRCTST